ncbi:MAG: hypothetical protein SF187_08110 [Deltaproteobacteria bacterium]|nr:hypothetical protein [Deltaproteobacteria bacterium]
MSPCPTCGHANPPSFSVCSRCGANLPGGGDDPIASLAADQARARKRSRTIYGAVAVVGLGLLAAFAVKDRMTKAAVGKKLQWLDTWAEQDKAEVGSLLNCLTQSNLPVDAFSTADQVQAKVEQAAGVQPKTFAEHLRVECMPIGDRVTATFAAKTDVPEEFKAGFDAYKGSLPKLKDGIGTFADRLDVLIEGGDMAAKLQAAGDAWHASETPTPESIAFERFLQCAVPGIAQIKDAQGLLQTLATECYKKDAAGFMQTVQDKCGALVTKIDISAKPSATYKASMKKFYEPEQRMMKAWEDCVRRGRKGGRDNNLAQFLHAFGEYVQARVEIARAAKALSDAS